MPRIALLRDRHRGQRGVIVANGPSLNDMDLRCLRGENIVGLNKIYLGLQRFGFYPRYYVAINEKVIQQSKEEIKRLRCVKFLGSHARAWGLEEDGLTYIVDTEHPPARFSRDLAKGMHEGWTVTYAALQVAYFLGFSQVVLVGLDHRYAFQGDPNAPSRMQGRDPNHFSPAYFADGQEWDNPDLSRSEESFRIARAEFERDGREILDATQDGACTVFRKADFRSIFR